jgi:hypothetical protein
MRKFDLNPFKRLANISEWQDRCPRGAAPPAAPASDSAPAGQPARGVLLQAWLADALARINDHNIQKVDQLQLPWNSKSTAAKLAA